MHAAVLGGIAVQPVTERVLWRLEQASHAWDLLVLTQSKPSWEHLVEQAGWPGADGGAARIASYDPLLALVMKGRQFRFRVRANPTSAKTRPDSPTPHQASVIEETSGHRGFRVGHRTASHQLEWFAARASDGAERWGFTVGSRANPRVAITERERLSFRRRPSAPLVTLETATFEGLLEVTDPDRFVEVITGGLGGAKAYGCGLLTIAGVESGVVDS
jgi:CRISPR system Cascade subunit CasE